MTTGQLLNAFFFFIFFPVSFRNERQNTNVHFILKNCQNVIKTLTSIIFALTFVNTSLVHEGNRFARACVRACMRACVCVCVCVYVCLHSCVRACVLTICDINTMLLVMVVCFALGEVQIL